MHALVPRIDRLVTFVKDDMYFPMSQSSLIEPPPQAIGALPTNPAI